MQHRRVLLDIYTLDPRRLQLLDRGNGVVAVIPDLHDLYAVFLGQREDEPLHEAIVDDFLPAGEAAAGCNQPFIVHVLFGDLDLHAPLGNKAPYFGVEDVAFHGHHGHRRVIVRLGQIQTQPHPAPLPEGQVFFLPAPHDFLDVDVALHAQALVHDVAVFAEEVLPLVFIQDCHAPQVLDGLEHLSVVHGDRVCLVDHQVIRLPPLPQRVIRFVQQGENILTIQDTVQNLFRNVDLVDHYVVVIGILRGDDDPQLVDQRDLRGPHGLHRIAVQRPGLVRQEDVGQPAVHAVVGVGQGRILDLVEKAGDHVPGDLEMLYQRRRDLDDLPHRQAQLRGELIVRRHREEAGKARLCQHPQDENDRAVESLEVLPGNFQQRRLVKSPVIPTAAGAENSDDQEPGIVLQPLVHGAVEIRMHHQLQQPADLPKCLFADIGILMLAVGDL